jgi:hypothetical protein
MDKLTGLKDAPLWFLSATAVIALALWRIAVLRALVPADYQKFLPLAALVLGVLTVAQALNRVRTSRAARLAVRREQQLLRLQKVYRPMLALFTSRHVTASSAILAPRFRHRFKRAWEVWNDRRRWRGKFKGAWRALWDHQEINSAGMEFGGSFPIDKIVAIAEANSDHVDATLHGFVRRADRSRYEDESNHGMLTEAEYELFQHLWMEEARLSKATGH